LNGTTIVIRLPEKSTARAGEFDAMMPVAAIIDMANRPNVRRFNVSLLITKPFFDTYFERYMRTHN
jgi:hypothetical protein